MRFSEARDLVTLKQERVLDVDKQDNRRSQLDLEWGYQHVISMVQSPCPEWYQQ